MNKWITIFALAGVAAAVSAADTNAPASRTDAATPASATKQPTVITSERLQVDYAHNMGTFEGNVLAVDPRITVRADKMIVQFSGNSTNSTRSLQKIVADGGVVITVGERKSTSDHAEYTAEDGKVVLTGNPRVQSPDGTVSGDRITFWHGQEKMDVESGTRLIIYPEEQRKKSDEDAKGKDSKP